MPQEIEVILTRQLASSLAMPIFIVDSRGNLIFYNESAEKILGQRFEETGEMPAAEWSTKFTPTDEDGTPLSPEMLPLVIAFTQGRPAHRRLWIYGLDNVRRCIEVTAFPLIGQAERKLGAVAIFWEVKAS
ncbi:MAG: PAS domain-containing protein [Candidatus Tectomicrobia bacterium]|nr:PAS domain-containing protein [Candidatus Tectomicrobia bacterium]